MYVKRLNLRSYSGFEQFKISFDANNDLEQNEIDFNCVDRYSPITADIILSASDESTNEIMRRSKLLTEKLAAKMLRYVREEQRYGELQPQELNCNLTQSIASLVLAQINPALDFSLANLEPNSVRTLKILAIEHTNKANVALANRKLCI
jgi:hypothetical protein